MSPTDCLRDLVLREEYRSDRDDLLTGFYIPCLEIATSYDRAVGYFTSAGLASAGRGLGSFIARGSNTRLVASPHLTAEDYEALQRGHAARTDLIARRLLDALTDLERLPDNLILLAWLVANRRLDIRLAVPSGPGIYHEKLGIFEDLDGCKVAFAGSANETVGGFINNFESIDVFFSWDSSSSRVLRKSENFAGLWDGKTANLEVVDLPQAVEHKLVQIAEQHRNVVAPFLTPRPRSVGPMAAPIGFQARDYQKSAAEAFLANGGRGIFSMATGSGKTKTALSAISRLLQLDSAPRVVIVVVPYVHLVDQWADEYAEWGIKPIRCYEASASWVPIAQEAIDALPITQRPIALITTLRSATLAPFQSLLEQLDGSRVVLVGDEVHHLGASHASAILKPGFRWRLGLSATPHRWHDDVGSQLLESYFEGIVFEFGLTEAIAAGHLVPYHYEPLLVELDREELEEYRLVVGRIETAASRREDRDVLLKLLDERSRILNGAAGKPTHVRADIAGRRLSHALFYCVGRLQMGAVSDVLRSDGYVPRPFTAEEDRHTRTRLLEDFAVGLVPAIVAMRALDEGVDIPGTREAHLLASSGNPREFIQRRGRILRPAPAKSSARLVDYVAVPEAGGSYERELVEREMTRVLDFASSSLEPDKAREAVWPILDAYDLIHLVGRT